MKYVRTNIGNIPIEDYLDIKAGQFGFDSYEELKAEGYDIQIAESDIVEVAEV